MRQEGDTIGCAKSKESIEVVMKKSKTNYYKEMVWLRNPFFLNDNDFKSRSARMLTKEKIVNCANIGIARIKDRLCLLHDCQSLIMTCELLGA